MKLEKCSPEPTHHLVFLGAVLDNLHVSGFARGTDQSDTGSMPGNARVSVNIPGTVEPLGPHEPCRTDRPVDSTIILQSPAVPAGSASPVWMETKVSDVIVLTLPGGPEMVGVPDSAKHNSQDITPPPFDLTIRTDASLLGWGATCNGTSTGGRWNVEEAEQHINCLELKAAILALKAFLRVGMQLPPQSLGHHTPRHIPGFSLEAGNRRTPAATFNISAAYFC